MYRERTLVTDLKYRPEDFVFLLSFVGGVLGIFHLIAEFKQGIFKIVKARWRRLAIARRSDWGHDVSVSGMVFCEVEGTLEEKREAYR